MSDYRIGRCQSRCDVYMTTDLTLLLVLLPHPTTSDRAARIRSSNCSNATNWLVTIEVILDEACFVLSKLENCSTRYHDTDRNGIEDRRRSRSSTRTPHGRRSPSPGRHCSTRERSCQRALPQRTSPGRSRCNFSPSQKSRSPIRAHTGVHKTAVDASRIHVHEAMNRPRIKDEPRIRISRFKLPSQIL
jgi:hypothetical protein